MGTKKNKRHRYFRVNPCFHSLSAYTYLGSTSPWWVTEKKGVINRWENLKEVKLQWGRPHKLTILIQWLWPFSPVSPHPSCSSLILLSVSRHYTNVQHSWSFVDMEGAPTTRVFVWTHYKSSKQLHVQTVSTCEWSNVKNTTGLKDYQPSLHEVEQWSTCIVRLPWDAEVLNNAWQLAVQKCGRHPEAYAICGLGDVNLSLGKRKELRIKTILLKEIMLQQKTEKK